MSILLHINKKKILQTFKKNLNNKQYSKYCNYHIHLFFEFNLNNLIITVFYDPFNL